MFCPDAVAALPLRSGRAIPAGCGALLLFGGLRLGSLIQVRGLRAERIGAVAQLGEHLLCKQGVSGSIPLSSTITVF